MRKYCRHCIFFFFGIASFEPIIGKVLENSSAKENDLRVNDIIITVNDSIEHTCECPKL